MDRGIGLTDGWYFTGSVARCWLKKTAQCLHKTSPKSAQITPIKPKICYKTSSLQWK